MSVEHRWRSGRTLPPLLAALALVLAACDGGIFGTGDGSDVVASPPDGSSPPSLTGSGVDPDGDDGGEGDVEGPGSGGTDGGVDTAGEDAGDGDASGSVPIATFSNTLDVGADAAAPRLRLVNASALSVQLIDEEGTPLSGPGVPSGAIGAFVELPPAIDELRLRRTDEDGEAALLYRLLPTALSMSSVTTLIVRDADASGEPNRGVDVVALETRLAPSDPAQALVRVVQGAVTNDPDEEAVTTRYRLVPAGASPGGVEVAFDGIAFGDDPTTRYRDVPAGDYRLEGSAPNGDGTALSPRSLSIGPDSVHTFVILGTESVIDVVDSSSAKR